MIHLTKAVLLKWLERLLHTYDTPRRTAFAFALGVLVGFSPLLGLHTILCLILAFALDLNRVAVLVGTYMNLPWFIGPYYTVATILGARLLGTGLPPGLRGQLGAVLERWHPGEVIQLIDLLRPLIWAYTLGSTILAALASIVAYQVALAFIVAHRRRVAQSGQTT